MSHLVLQSVLLASMPMFGAAQLHDLSSINKASLDKQPGAMFTVTTRVSRIYRGKEAAMPTISVRTDDVRSILGLQPSELANTIQPGDTICANGELVRMLPLRNTPVVRTLKILSHGDAEPIGTATLAEILAGHHDYSEVIVSAFVTDVFLDEIDSRYLWMTLSDDNGSVSASCFVPAREHGHFNAYIGARIKAHILVVDSGAGLRVRLKKTLSINPEKIEILKPAPADPFDIPGRQRQKGVVLTCWQKRNILLYVRDAPHFCRVELSNDNLPDVGDFVEVAGIPMTDLYNDNLSRAIWRQTDGWTLTPQQPQDTDPQDILETGASDGLSGINPQYHGRLVRLTGRMLDMPNTFGRFNLDCRGHTVVVDSSEAPIDISELEPGCLVSVTGVCVLDIPNWIPGGPFPHIAGFMLVLRSKDDTVILSRAPWWTPGRFLVTLAVLLLLIVLVCAWNFSLRILVARRSRQLVREQAKKLASELRIDERTRLAAELHDSVAQNLSSVSMQLNALQLASDEPPSPFSSALKLATMTLESCQRELRNCLWDLRSQALDEPDLASAIAKTLKPILGSAKLRIRFNISRQLMSDKTTHAILRIVRELASNALHHGHATSLTLAGCLDGRTIRFSLADNGSGFDPSAVQGVGDGHFGLSGIHDRVNKLNGTFSISSGIGKGTKATITLNAR